MWKTFLFNYGMIRRLVCSEFPVLIFVPINFLMFAGERFLRIVSALFKFKLIIVLLGDVL